MEILRRVRKALEPSKEKWFDLNDLKLIGGSALALVGGWAIVSWLIIIL